MQDLFWIQVLTGINKVLTAAEYKTTAYNQC